MTAELDLRRVRGPLLALLVPACLATAAVDAGAMRGEEMTTCASPELEDPARDECFGAIDEMATVSRRGVVRFRLYCMEDPGDRCTGQYEAPWIRQERLFYRIKKQGSFAVDAGSEGGPVRFKLSLNPRRARRIARSLRRNGGDLRLIIRTMQPSGALEITSIDEIVVGPRPPGQR